MLGRIWGWSYKVLCALMLTAVMAVFVVAGTALAAEPQDKVFTDYGRGYHLVDFLNGYNVLAFGHVQMNVHAMGAVLIQDYLDGTASGIGDGEKLPPSFIKGLYKSGNIVYNSRNKQTNAPIYLGEENTVEARKQSWGDVYYYYINGSSTAVGYGNGPAAYVNEHFFNFAEAKTVIVRDQQTMLSRATDQATLNGNVLTVQAGTNVRIDSLAGIGVINIQGEATANTTINVTVQGDVVMPMMWINGSQPSVQEQSNTGTSIVWNVPNADSIHLPTQNWVGHVIAPQADVRMDGGNYNGCIICEDFATSAEGHIYSYTADTTSWDVVFSVEKVWQDGNDADGKRPDTLQVTLYKQVGNSSRTEVKTVTLSEANDWSYVWTELPEKDGNDLITYSVEEEYVPEYESKYIAATNTLINTHTPETVAISGTKTWAGEPNFGAFMRPETITLHLYADGEKVASQTLTVDDSANTQTYTFGNLPRYKNGREITYTVHEDNVPGYIGTTNGLNITNTWGTEPISVSGTKYWNDDQNRDRKRPASIIVQLYANNIAVPGEQHVVSAATGWTYSFTNLTPVDAQGNRIVYTVKEVGVPAEYTSSYSGYDIYNTYVPEKISVSGSKTWIDDNNRDGLRPASINVVLLADGARFTHQTVTPDANGNWTWTFHNVPKYAEGKEIRYSVMEEVIPEGYSATTSGMDLTNTHLIETVDIVGGKTWADDNNRDGIRPESITIHLYADGEEVANALVDELDQWAWRFTGLPKYKDGKEIVYTIQEDAVTDYQTQINGYDVVNTHVPETVDISAEKQWNDNDNQDGLRPASVLLKLYKQTTAGGTKTEVDTLRIYANASGAWKGTFEDLPRYENGDELIYTIEEEPVPGYTATVQAPAKANFLTALLGADGSESGNTWTITNTHAPETVSVSVIKAWEDNENANNMRPEHVTIYLHADGQPVMDGNTPVSATVTAEGDWKHTFTGLPKYKKDAQGSHQIIYTIAEQEVPGYTTRVLRTNTDAPQTYEYNVINTYDERGEAKTRVAGYKRWIDNHNQDGKRPESVTIHLYQDGQLYATAVVSRSGQTTTIYQNNNQNNSQNNNQNNSQNNNQNNSQNSDGTEDAWMYAFEDLPKYDANGQPYVYTVGEEAVEGYQQLIDGHNIINTHVPETISISGGKVWNDDNNRDGKRPQSITIRLKAGSEEVSHRIVRAENNWAWTFTDLPKYKAGQEIAYTITEDAVEGYTTSVEGYDVKNTYAPETTAVSGSKTWADDNNRDGKRPDSITINLLADGTLKDSKTVNAADNWAWTFGNLPKYKNVGGAAVPIHYSITENAVVGYTTSVSGYDVTNTHVPEKISISGSKTWDDNNNQDGKRPPHIFIRLYADGQPTSYMEHVHAEEGGWTWEFVGLPKYRDGGTEIVYSIREYTEQYDANDPGASAQNPVPGYTTTYQTGTDGSLNVTNTRVPETVHVQGVKHWRDQNNHANMRPNSIAINLLADGVVKESKTVTEASGWAWDFGSLPKYKDGQEIVYTVTEDAVERYITEYGPGAYDVTNYYDVEKFTVTGSKTWVDDNNKAGRRPESITLYLLADGELKNTKVVTPDANGNWTWTFEELPRHRVNDGRTLIHYTLVEHPVEGYEATAEGFNLTNTYVLTDFYVTKVWEGKESGAVNLTLYADDVALDPQPTYEKKDDVYYYKDLPKENEQGKKIVYSVIETPEAGYAVRYENPVPHAHDHLRAYHGGRIINTELTDVRVRKIWQDGDRKNRPAITLTLHEGGRAMGAQPVGPDKDGWYTFKDLPKYVGGKEAVYTVTEAPVEGYITTYVNENGELDAAYPGGTIINTMISTILGDLPETGDDTHLMQNAALLLFSAVGLIVMRRKRRTI